jgi:Mlc titration factor MtfA (ptsG expression regulator)
MDLQMRVINLSDNRFFDRYPQVMVFPSEFLHDIRRLMVFPVYIVHNKVCFAIQS